MNLITWIDICNLVILLLLVNFELMMILYDEKLNIKGLKHGSQAKVSYLQCPSNFDQFDPCSLKFIKKF
jgi:hypothetical protein